MVKRVNKQTPPGPPHGPGSSKEDWIASQLRHVYDETLSEAIPSDLLALLDQLDEAEGAASPEKGGEPS